MTKPNYEYYGLLATYWDLLRGDTSKWPDRAFYLDVIKKYGQPVLDVGCSSGRLILDYLAQGIDIDGVDISPEMIAMCKQNAEKKNLKPNLYVQSMAELNIPRKYKIIMVPSSTIQLIIEPDETKQAMKRAYDHLETGSILIASFMGLWGPDRPLESDFSMEAERPEDGAIVRHKGWFRFDPETKLQHTRDIWEVIKDGQVIESEIHEQSPATHSYNQAEAIALYEAAGFKDIQVLDSKKLEPAKSEATSFSVLGIKQ